jgi:hypothetical protein
VSGAREVLICLFWILDHGQVTGRSMLAQFKINIQKPRISSGVIGLIIVAITLGLVRAVSPGSLRVVLFDGSIAALILIAAAGLGITLLKLLRFEINETRWLLLAGTGLGLGLLALLVLGLGTLGAMHRGTWITLLAVLCLLALWHATQLNPISKISERSADPAEVGDPDAPDRVGNPVRAGSAPGPNPKLTWMWLLVVLFLTIALLAASIPPGILWSPEGNGYDVLEYHLGAPREYFDAGRITYLPHNIYSNFPFNVEMLYLLCMVIRGGATAAAGTASMLNVLLGVLAIAAVWLAGMEYSRKAALFAAISAATCPFMSYLSGIAYVENGMLFFSALALAAVLRGGRADRPWRWIILAALFTGLACGSKYTALYSIAAPLALSLGAIPRHRSSGHKYMAVFVLLTALTLSPWLIKNAIYTGSPFFPLARKVIHERPGIWDDERAEHWREGHLPAPEDRRLPRRISRLFHEVFISPLFGPTIGFGCLSGLLLLLLRFGKRIRWFLSCTLTILFVGLLCWLWFTHMVDRFAIGMLIPASLLLGIGLSELQKKGRGGLAVAIIVLLAGLNLYDGGKIVQAESVLPLSAILADGGPKWMLEGQAAGSAHIPALNELAHQGRRILMIGDARSYYLAPGIDYTVVFNRNPFAEAAANGPAAAGQWLADHNYDYVYVDWMEMSRLRNSRYGFWPALTPEAIDAMVRAALLRPIQNFEYAPDKPPYSTLFQLHRP